MDNRPQPGSRFLQLIPAEVRVEIYKRMIDLPDMIDLSLLRLDSDVNFRSRTEFLQQVRQFHICKTIENEALPLVYERGTFWFRTAGPAHGNLMNVIRDEGLSLIRKIQMDFELKVNMSQHQNGRPILYPIHVFNRVEFALEVVNILSLLASEKRMPGLQSVVFETNRDDDRLNVVTIQDIQAWFQSMARPILSGQSKLKKITGRVVPGYVFSRIRVAIIADNIPPERAEPNTIVLESK
ncbi:MAG: hypothetical protein Q9227_008436 [Pyrenula ochraceoflavens]